jgi:hypothetical protein
MGRFPVLIICFFCFAAQAQPGLTSRQFYTPTASFNVGLISEAGYNSTIITPQYFFNTVRHNRPSGRLNQSFSLDPVDRHTIGGDFNTGGYFMASPDTLFKIPGASFFGSFFHRDHFNGSFSRDLLDLGSQALSFFLNDSADLGRFDFTRLTYQQLQGGIMFGRGTTGIALSLLKGQRHERVSMPAATLYGTSGLDQFDLSLLMDVWQTDRNRRDFHHVNGVGASVDLFRFFNIRFNDTIRNRLLIEIRDLGFIAWNQSASRYFIDTTLVFSGFPAQNFITLRDSVFGEDSESSAENFAISGRRRYTTLLPAFIHIADIYNVNEFTSLTGGLIYRINANYGLYYYLRGSYRFSPNVEVAARLAYGGFGNLNIGSSLKLRLFRKYVINLGSENIEGLIFPRSATGVGAFLAFQRRF